MLVQPDVFFGNSYAIVATVALLVASNVMLAISVGVAMTSAAGLSAVFGVIEHWFLVLPLRVADLWAWGLRSRETAGADHPAAGARPVLPPATGLATPRAVPPPTLVA